MSETLLVVPCYNEAQRLPRDAFLRFAQENPDTGFLFVNDGSSDETLTVLEQLASEHPQAIDVLDQQPNRGKAEAVRVGLLAAFAKGPRFVGFWDAEVQEGETDVLMEALGGGDLFAQLASLGSSLDAAAARAEDDENI